MKNAARRKPGSVISGRVLDYIFFFAAQGLQPFFAAQGFLAAQGLQPRFFAAQGLQPFLAAQGWQPFFAAQGLQAAIWIPAELLMSEAAAGRAIVVAARAATLSATAVFFMSIIFEFP